MTILGSLVSKRVIVGALYFRRHLGGEVQRSRSVDPGWSTKCSSNNKRDYTRTFCKDPMGDVILRQFQSNRNNVGDNFNTLRGQQWPGHKEDKPAAWQHCGQIHSSVADFLEWTHKHEIWCDGLCCVRYDATIMPFLLQSGKFLNIVFFLVVF